MVKKRKLRSSEPESAEIPEEPQQLQPEPQVVEEEGGEEREAEEEEQQQDVMDEEEEEEAGGGGGEEEQEVVEEDEEIEGQGNEEHVDGSDDAVSTEAAPVDANGGENVAEDANDGDESEEEPIEKLMEPFSREQLANLLKEAVEKFPELVDSIRKLADADPAHRKIFVHGLGWDTTAETLTSEFSKYGEVEDCKAVTDKVSGKSKGYAFILFKHRSGARKALKEPQKKIGSRMTSCQLASAGPVPAPPPVAPPVSEYTLRKIFVSNVSTEIDPERLLEFFQQYGEVEDGPLGLDKQTGKPRGFALFVYKSTESARKALEEPHKNFEGYTLHCQKAIDGPKQGKQPYHQPHYQQHYPSSRKEKSKYTPGGGGGHGHGHGGHLMAPSGPGVGFNPAVAAQALNPALGQALTALLATQGAGLGLTNLLGGLGGAPMNQAGPPVMNAPGYGNQAGVNYGAQPGMQGGYHNPQMGQSSGGRPQPGVSNMGGAPYMGR